MIDVEIGVARPGLRIRMPADQDTLPLVRQALRSLGESVDAEVEALEDAELALTEACANAVEHAYGTDGGQVDVRLQPEDGLLRVDVVDRGVGVSEQVRDGLVGPEGFGLPMIRSIATEMSFRGHDGTHLEMVLPLGSTELDGHPPGALGVEPAERILRRLVAVVAALQDMPTERVMEGLLVAELVARSALRSLSGDRVQVHIDLVESGFEIRVGPLVPGGAQSVMDDSEVPTLGSVIDRLADGVRTDLRDDAEHLTLRVESRAQRVG